MSDAILNGPADTPATFRTRVKTNPWPPTRRQVVAFLVVVLPFLGTVLVGMRALTDGVRIAEIAILVVFYTLTIIGLVIGYHRLFTHASFKTSKSMRVALAILGGMTAQGPILTWVADHSRHHAHSDTEDDLHSPNMHGRHLTGRLRGFWHSHIGWMFSNYETPWNRYVLNMVKDRRMFWVHTHYFWWVGLGLALPTLAGLVCIGSWQGALSGFLWGGLMRIFLLDHVIWCVGSVCHLFGDRPFSERTKDLSANNWWVSLFSFGDGNQNNHHAFPSSAAHGLRWWEPDFAYLIIRAMAAVGLVWDVKRPPREEIDCGDAKLKRT